MPSADTERVRWIVFQCIEAFRYARPLDWVDMAAVVSITYVLLTGLARTRAARVARGVGLLILVYWLAGLFLPVLHYLMYRALLPGVVGLMIVFQSEVRTFLAQLGGFLWRSSSASSTTCEQLVDTCIRLSRDRTGAIIAIERSVPITDIAASGVRLDAEISPELLRSIFVSTAPLHDGGVVISNDRIVAAACQFPTSTNPDLDVSLGMRHRAGIGLTEQTDAICLIVSEETGAISLAESGHIHRNLSRDELESRLRNLVESPAASSSPEQEGV